MSQYLPIVLLAGLAVVFGILSTLVACAYVALLQRHVVGNTSLGGVRLASGVTGRGLLGLVLGNVLISVATLGIGYPIVLHRNARFVTRTLWIDGALDAPMQAQSTQASPRHGEGMFQVFGDSGVL